MRRAPLPAGARAKNTDERDRKNVRERGGTSAQRANEREPVQRQERCRGIGKLYQAVALDGRRYPGGIYHDCAAAAPDARWKGPHEAATARSLRGVDLPVRAPRAPTGPLYDQVGAGGPFPEVHRPGTV